MLGKFIIYSYATGMILGTKFKPKLYISRYLMVGWFLHPSRWNLHENVYAQNFHHKIYEALNLK